MSEGDRKEETIRFQEGQARVEREDQEASSKFPSWKRPLVRIIWSRPGRGSSYNDGTEWTRISAAWYREPIMVDTVGFLLQETDTSYLVTQSIDEKGENKGRVVIGKDTVRDICFLDKAGRQQTIRTKTAPAT